MEPSFDIDTPYLSLKVDHVHQALNQRDNDVFKLSPLKERMQQQFNSVLNGYFDGDLISWEGVKALLYSTGYLLKSSK